ncbi:hypothetical protein ACFL5O_00420 [Myxococcota bacterium]
MVDLRQINPARWRSLRKGTLGVKQPNELPTASTPSGRLARHLEGWRLGLVSVGIAVVGIILILPRKVEPDVLPLPRVDRAEQHRAQAVESSRAQVAYNSPLPLAVRTVGERFRRYGRAAADRDAARAHSELTELRRTAMAARARYGADPLLVLRAVQGEFFLQAISRWEDTGRQDDELLELSGDWLVKAEASGWLARDRRWKATRGERATLFRIRWTQLNGLLETHPFTPTLDDWRVYYRFLLQHPESKAGDCTGRGQSEMQLRYVSALARRDPEYPALLAVGVLEYRLGAPARSAAALRAFLDQHPQGRWRLRAQNHLRAALQQVQKLP